MTDLTAIILTKNENLNIGECIKSLKKIAKRIIIVDSFSTDNTIEIAKKLDADVYQHKFVDYATQFNWALDEGNINTKWCLRIDADERFTPELTKEIEKLIEVNSDTNINGIVLEAQMFFMGKRLKFGASTKRKLMVFKTSFGRIEKRRMDEHTILSQGKTIIAKNKYLHYDYKNIDIFVKKLNWYATREMQDFVEFNRNKKSVDLHDKKINKTRFKKFKIYYRFPLFLRTKLLFFYFYIVKLGFLDGREGFIYNYLYTRFYRILVDIKIYEQHKFQNEFIETGDLK